MQKFELTSTMVKTLKGAPLSVLMLLILARQPVSAQYLERESGYSDKAVNSALLYLADHGMITRNGRYAWQIAAGVKALPLMNLIDETEEGPETVDVGAQTSEPEPAEVDDSADDLPEIEKIAGTRRNSESEKFRLPSSSRSLTNSFNKDLSTTTTMAMESEKFRVDEVVRECVRAGIWEDRAEELASMPHVTMRLVRYWIQWAVSKGKDLPLAAWRIEHNIPVPKSWVDMGAPGAQIIDETPDMAFEPELPEEIVHAWEAALIILQKQYKKPEFETWIKSLRLMGFESGKYLLQTGNRCGEDWIEQNALEEIKSALQSSVQIIVGG